MEVLPLDSLNFLSNIAAAKKLVTYKMMFTFQPRNPDELTISEGDIVQVDENHETPAAWLYGTCNGNSGLFPANYAKKVQDEYVDIDDASKVSLLL